MEIKLFDSELKVMEVLWERGESKAGELVKILKEETGWNRNTTYTVNKENLSSDEIAKLKQIVEKLKWGKIYVH